MNLIPKKACLVIIVCLFANFCKGQLVITNETNAQALAQKLVGDGITVSNVTFTGNSLMAGYFNNSISHINPAIDSGIVLTSGEARSDPHHLPTPIYGLNGDGVTTASAGAVASHDWSLNGDADLATLIGEPVSNTHDACVLEFDFVPLGDSIKFRYSFTSEEYTEAFVCEYNDAFAFLISGPGFTGLQNIALVPGTSTPVSIFNVNDVPGGFCPNNPAYFIDNSNNTYLNYDGLTTVLSALARVQPCQTYHLKLVVSDVGDGVWDSGVFLEAKSLTSNAFQLINQTQTDNNGKSYLVEGCATGSLKIKRQAANLFSQTVDLGYGGTAINGVDVQMLPSSITIPANETEVLLNIFPIIDNLPEGIETLKIYTLAPCGVPTPTDSAEIQIRDYDTLGILPDTAVICMNGSVQLTASTGYSTYQWDANPALSNALIRDPVVTPLADSTMFYCSSQEGTCHGRDSAFVYWKRLKFVSKTDVNCHGASTGQIVVSAGPEWISPLDYSINNSAFQPGNAIYNFNNLPVGTHTVKVKDATGCIDSLVIIIGQAFPDLVITNSLERDAGCSGSRDGVIEITASGGNPPLQYSSDAITFQNSNTFNLNAGTYVITVKDNNGCTVATPNIVVNVNDTVTISIPSNPTICESKSVILPALTNGASVVWTPAATLNNATIVNPVASPTITTQYYITATIGICNRLDSVIVHVNPAPTANAGKDSTICFGGSLQLLGSGGIDYKWSPSNYLSSTTINNPISTKPTTITYYLEVTDANGCVSLSKDAVVITVSPPAKLNAGADTAVAINQPLQLFAHDINNIGFIQYTWTPASGLNNPFIPNPVAILSDPKTMLIVTANTINNCEGIDTIIVKTFKGPEIYVANSFTPNGDGINDLLRAFPVGLRSFNYFRIFNRYGELVFSTTNENIGWDGKYKGALQNMNTFVWIAAGVDYHGNTIQRKGTTTIIQ